MTERDFDLIRSSLRSVSEIASSRLLPATADAGTKTLEIMAESVSANYFAVTQLALVRGRGLHAVDERGDQQPTLVLSRTFWESKLGGDPAIIGATIRVSGHRFQIVGIAGAGEASARDLFGIPRLGAADVWITHPGAMLIEGVGRDRTVASLTVFSRVTSSQDVVRVAAEFSVLGGSLDVADRLKEDAGVQGRARSWSAATLDSLERSSLPSAAQFGAMVLAIVGLVLMVASTNIAILVVGRGVDRRRELTIRRALGATRGRLIIEQVAESGVVAILGGAGGLLVAKWLCRILTADLPVVGTRSLWVRPELDMSAFMVAGAALVTSFVVFGIGPALHLTPREAGSQPVGGETVRWRGRRWLIASQVSISTAVLVLTAAALGATVEVARHDVGFDLSQLSIALVNVRSLKWDAPRIDRVIQAIDNMTERGFGSSPAALTSGLPIGSGGLRGRIATVGSGDREAAAVTLAATPGILKTLGVPLLRGRGFDQHEVASKASVIVISETVARQLFGTVDAVGRQVTQTDSSDGAQKAFEVIGIASDTDTGDLFNRRAGSIYLPMSFRKAQDSFALLVRGDDPEAMSTTLAQVLHHADPDLAPAFLGAAPRLLTPAFVLLRAVATLASALSILALALAMLGLYSVLSHLVAKRTREIGVRLALGANVTDVRRMVIFDGTRPVMWGIMFGLIVGAGARLIIQRTLVGSLAAVDASFAFVAALLVVTAFTASMVPARRASRVDPSVALRDL